MSEPGLFLPKETSLTGSEVNGDGACVCVCVCVRRHYYGTVVLSQSCEHGIWMTSDCRSTESYCPGPRPSAISAASPRPVGGIRKWASTTPIGRKPRPHNTRGVFSRYLDNTKPGGKSTTDRFQTRETRPRVVYIRHLTTNVSKLQQFRWKDGPAFCSDATGRARLSSSSPKELWGLIECECLMGVFNKEIKGYIFWNCEFTVFVYMWLEVKIR